ncbi:winged helix-turn-helix domain-containing protein [Paenibacillus durus]|uniref:winged helix-turn-helix domain-containing protein n=1 Tax=Paenibacillus durus TaxID=44251 RepID=UPI002D218994|nr:response regulator transcription factor [Paenibacillus durus]
MVKPFSPGEVVARVKAQLRRYNQLSVPADKSDVLSFQNLKINLQAYTVELNDKYVDFTTKEFEVLRFLALHANQVLTRQQIYENVWGINEYGDLNTVTIHIKKIREKIEDDISAPQFIKTVWGVGYKFGGSGK